MRLRSDQRDTVNVNCLLYLSIYTTRTFNWHISILSVSCPFLTKCTHTVPTLEYSLPNVLGSLANLEQRSVKGRACTSVI